MARFDFEVGFSEPHTIQVNFNKITSLLTIRVDGLPVIRDLGIAWSLLSKDYSFSVGANVRHQVTIQKERPLALAGFRPHIVRVFVDNELVATHTV
jgi:hypothetical protein